MRKPKFILSTESPICKDAMAVKPWGFIILIISYLLACAGLASAALISEDSSQSPIARFKKAMGEPVPDALEEKLNEVKNIELEQTAKNLGIDYETAATLKSLKNPFIAQFPNKGTSMITVIPTQQEPGNVPEGTPHQIPPPQFTVSGMVWNTKKPSAIINGNILNIGDQVNSWQIKEITKEGIHVTYENENLWIKPVANPSRVGPGDTPTRPSPR